MSSLPDYRDITAVDETSGEFGLRRRAGKKMVPRISPEFQLNSVAGRRRTSSSSEKTNARRNSKEVIHNLNADVGYDNPTVLIEDPSLPSATSHPKICETSFSNNDVLNLHENLDNCTSPNYSLSPTGDISLSSDDEEENVACSFNSRNLYRPILTHDVDDEITEESVILPDGEFKRIKEGDKEIEIRISTEEKSLTIALQVFFPFMIAGLGTVGAGLLLDVVQVSSSYH